MSAGGATTASASLLAGLAEHLAERRGETPRLSALRQAAAARWADTGFPTLHDEAYRFTNVAPIEKADCRPTAGGAALNLAAIEHATYEGCDRIVVSDGRFDRGASRIGALPSGVVIGGLADLIAAQPELIDRYLHRAEALEDGPFASLNTALFADGAVVYVPRGVTLERPVQIVVAATAAPQDGAPPVSFPRLLVVVEENAEAKVVESYLATGAGVYWTCAVTELWTGDHARLDHYKVQREGFEAFHTATQTLRTGRGTAFSSHSFSLGAAIARHDVNATLDGEGGDAILNGLYMLSGAQLCDTHMQVEHRAAHCGSHELYKGVLEGKSRGVFSGKIHVHPGAQKTDAKQTNRNLLLSKDALASSQPQLEIYADDVKCTHGSTVGQLDDEAVFYLRSRGIGFEAAKSLLTYAFASDVVERIRVDAVRHDMEAFLFSWLPMGDVVRDAV